MSDHKSVILIGGTGFVGRTIASLLVGKGYQVIIPTRSLSYAKPLSVLPLVKSVQLDIHEPQALDRLMASEKGCVAVINLVGILHDAPGKPYGKKFSKNHVELTRNIIAAMSACGIKRLLHMSALGADSAGPSMYQRSKGDAEKMVKASSLDWTIFRPSVIFGRDDSFINLFKTLLKFAPVMPLAGYHAKFQPVSVRNVAEVFVRSLQLPSTIHQSYDLGGPKIYSLAELVRFAGKIIGKQPLLIPLPHVLGYLQAFMIEKMPGPTLMSRDNVSSMLVDNVLPTEGNVIRDIFNLDVEPLESLLY
jgi:uncharacterized protein YbjT (DUF2867 family)